MGVDCNLYLPDQVRVDDVAKVMAIASGCSKSWDQGRWIKVEDQAVRVCDSVPSMVTIHLSGPHKMMAHYFFESEGGGRCLSARSRDEVIAVFRKVAACFGGFLVHQDCDDKGEYFRPYSNSMATNADEWMALQRHMDAVTPITDKDIREAQMVSAYDRVAA